MMEDKGNGILSGEEAFEITTLYALHNAIAHKPKKIILSDESFSTVIRDFFLASDKLTGILEVLTIKVSSSFPLTEYQHYIIKLFNGGLKSLCITANIIESIEIFFSNFNQYFPALEKLELNAEKYKKDLQLSAHEDSDEWPKTEVIKKCVEIISQNQEIREFIVYKLEYYASQIKKIISELPNSRSEEVDYRGLNAAQIQFLIELGKIFDKVSKYSRLNKSLSENPDFKLIERCSQEWDIFQIVRQGNLNKLQFIQPHLELRDLNRKDSSGYTLLDVAVNNNCYAIVKWLVDKGMSIAYSCDAFSSVLPLRNELGTNILLPEGKYRTPNFLIAWKQQNQELKEIFISNEPAIYDALAWCLAYGEERRFKEIYEKLKELNGDLETPIPEGIFQNFNLLQLLVYYDVTNLLLELTADIQDSVLNKELNQQLPDNVQLPYPGCTLLELLIYKGDYDGLIAFKVDKLFEELLGREPENNSRYLQLLFSGISKTKCSDQIIAKYRCCLKHLLKVIDYPLESLKLIIDQEKSFGGRMPLLHFAIEYNIFSMIKDSINLNRDMLANTILVNLGSTYVRINPYMPANTIPVNLGSTYVRINPLQLAIFRYLEDDDIESPFGKYKVIDELFSMYKQLGLLEETLTEPLMELGGLTLFQYVIQIDNNQSKYEIIKLMLQFNSCPINDVFPDSHKSYPKWSPLHVAIIKDFQDPHFHLLPLMLQHPHVDIKPSFLEGGDFKNSLFGYYPLSAVFYGINPNKGSFTKAAVLSFYADKLVQHLINSSISDTKKTQILTQALLMAILWHGATPSHNYKDEIELLISSGANIYQNHSDGQRIIDLAYEKGLGHLFAQQLTEDFSPVIRPSISLVKNERHSEFCQLTLSSYHIEEGSYAVVTLARNETSRIPDHVFLIIERIENGLSRMDFIDFVKDKNSGKGKIKHEKVEGNLHEALVFKERKGFKIDSLNDLILQQWQITIDACNKILRSIDDDKLLQLNYRIVGSNSFFAASSGEGDNCYTWARKKLLASEDPYIKKQLKPTFDEWLIAVPRLKLVSNQTKTGYLYRFFNNKLAVTGTVICIGALAGLIGYRYNSLEKIPSLSKTI